ncbi:hypothetical protein [Halopiger djelfimassiliensis]|uniref:hypothetical protein n=1 Tax=Halopiger djelfimassiliensis TaxID=1293047 RepID=UPI00067786F0|nr:hypothetical protein [Halopiger djelfimassiliensis]
MTDDFDPDEVDIPDSAAPFEEDQERVIREAYWDSYETKYYDELSFDCPECGSRMNFIGDQRFKCPNWRCREERDVELVRAGGRDE